MPAQVPNAQPPLDVCTRPSAVTVVPNAVSVGRTTASISEKGPVKSLTRKASIPPRYSRNGSEGLNGANGSAGVKINVVAHETAWRPIVTSNGPPEKPRLIRSRRWRHLVLDPE